MNINITYNELLEQDFDWDWDYYYSPEYEKKHQFTRAVATNPSATPQTLHNLAGHRHFEIANLVASHKNTSSETLNKLLDKHPRTAMMVASHPNATAEILDRAVKVDSNFFTHKRARQHKNLSPATRDHLDSKYKGKAW